MRVRQLGLVVPERTTPTYQPGHGVPVVVLPDPSKTYDSDDIISALWKELILALQRAKMVLVLGHSLGDDALITALRDYVTPPLKLAVGIWAEANNDSNPTVNRVEHCPNELRGGPIGRAEGVG